MAHEEKRGPEMPTNQLDMQHVVQSARAALLADPDASTALDQIGEIRSTPLAAAFIGCSRTGLRALIKEGALHPREEKEHGRTVLVFDYRELRFALLKDVTASSEEVAKAARAALLADNTARTPFDSIGEMRGIRTVIAFLKCWIKHYELAITAGLIHPRHERWMGKNSVSFDYAEIKSRLGKRIDIEPKRAPAGYIWCQDAIVKYRVTDFRLKTLRTRGRKVRGRWSGKVNSLRIGNQTCVSEVELSEIVPLREGIEQLIQAGRTLSFEEAAAHSGRTVGSVAHMASVAKVATVIHKRKRRVLKGSLDKFGPKGSKDRFCGVERARQFINGGDDDLIELTAEGRLRVRRWANGRVTYSLRDLAVIAKERRATKQLPKPPAHYLFLALARKKYAVGRKELVALVKSNDIPWVETGRGFAVDERVLAERYLLRSVCKKLIKTGEAVELNRLPSSFGTEATIRRKIKAGRVTGFRFSTKGHRKWYVVLDSLEDKNTQFVRLKTALRVLGEDEQALERYFADGLVESIGGKLDRRYRVSDLSAVREAREKREFENYIGLRLVLRALTNDPIRKKELTEKLTEMTRTFGGRPYVLRSAVRELQPEGPHGDKMAIADAAKALDASASVVLVYALADKIALFGSRASRRDVQFVKILRLCGDRLEESTGRVTEVDLGVRSFERSLKAVWRDPRIIHRWREKDEHGITEWYYWRTEAVALRKKGHLFSI